MHELVQMFEANPSLRAIKLQLKNIKDLTPLVVVLSKFKYLQELSLHGNKISNLPSLESLRQLLSLDISNNPIPIDAVLLDKLYLIPKLQQLSINANREQSATILEALPNLRILNHTPVNRLTVSSSSQKEELDAMCVKLEQEMRRIKQTYNKLASSLQDINNQTTVAKEQQFNFLYKDVQEEMCYFYTGLQDKLSRQGVFAYCKNKLMTVMDTLILRALDEVGNDSVVKIYEQIAKMKNENFDLLLKIIFNSSYQKYVDNKVDQPSNHLRKEAIYQNQIFRLKKETFERKKEQQKMQQIIQKQNNLIQKIQSPRRAPLSPHSFRKSPSAKNFNKKSPREKSLTKIQTEKGSLSRSPSARATAVSKKQPSRSGSTARLATTANSSRICSLQQLEELIREIMMEKRKFNQRNLRKNQPYETAQQFIFTFFSRRYGLKDIALDWSLSVIKAIESYCKQSIEVEVFGKILKGHLYEEYYDQCIAFAKQIQQSCPQKSVGESQFQRIFFYFFSYEDQESFEKIIGNFRFPLPIKELTYFLQSYKLAFQEKHLRKFIETFEKYDSDEDSALTSQECKQLISHLIKINEQLTESQKIQQTRLTISKMSVRRKNKFIFSQVFQLVHKII